METRFDRRLSEHDRRLDDLSDKVDFFVRSSLPPKEGVLFDGQVFDAHLFVCDLIGRTKKRIILIDNYIDATVLTLLDKREHGVHASIYTERISEQLRLDISRHNKQYPHIEVKEASRRFHDRFIVIDDTLYHIGASVKDLGKKLFAFSQMNINPSLILNNI